MHCDTCEGRKCIPNPARYGDLDWARATEAASRAAADQLARGCYNSLGPNAPWLSCPQCMGTSDHTGEYVAEDVAVEMLKRWRSHG